MERIDILKDFVNYCHDLKLNQNKKSVQNQYINAHMKYFTEYHGVKNFEEKRKEIENTIKYNPLTIAKLKKELANNLKELPF